MVDTVEKDGSMFTLSRLWPLEHESVCRPKEKGPGLRCRMDSRGRRWPSRCHPRLDRVPCLGSFGDMETFPGRDELSSSPGQAPAY